MSFPAQQNARIIWSGSREGSSSCISSSTVGPVSLSLAIAYRIAYGLSQRRSRKTGYCPSTIRCRLQRSDLCYTIPYGHGVVTNWYFISLQPNLWRIFCSDFIQLLSLSINSKTSHAVAITANGVPCYSQYIAWQAVFPWRWTLACWCWYRSQG